jgi:pyruvate formate lyase activating enzyme
MNRGLVGDIGRYAVHDGPGIRTTVFFKGCPLHCPWCHNPEFIAGKPEVAFYPERCLGCGDCVAACPEGAITVQGGAARILRSRCSGCGLCAAPCPALALKRTGQWHTVESLTELILRDRLFYETSGGGVTLSGGEPTQQLGFAGQLLRSLKGHGLHTAIQTCGLFSWEAFAEQALDSLDLIFFDLKLFDPAAHERWLGHGNATIIGNLQRLLRARPEGVVARIPLVPGYTAVENNIAALAELLRSMGVRRVALLPYHPWGLSKAGKIGRKSGNGLPGKPMRLEELSVWQRYFDQAELLVC